MSTRLHNPFAESAKNILLQMANIEAEPMGDFQPENDELASLGVASIISFAGKTKGRLLLDMEKSLALAITQSLTGTLYDNTSEYMVLASISELNNIIAGDANTQLNNMYSLGLRLAPPIVFSGKNITICVPKLPSATVDYTTKYGKLRANVAFERSL